jgi:hypothetical protein
LAFVGGFDEFVDQFRGQGVADPESLLGGCGAKCDEQVGFSGAAVAVSRVGTRRRRGQVITLLLRSTG